MKQTDLLKPGGSRQNLLVTLSREINDREKTLTLLKDKTVEHLRSWKCEALLQGQSLSKVKAMLTHGMWLDWLAMHCPLISVRTAQRYMHPPQNPGLRAALALCIEDEPAAASPLAPNPSPKAWPPYLEALGRVAKFVGYVERFPVGNWPAEGREKLRTDLEPVARLLWPEKFAL